MKISKKSLLLPIALMASLLALWGCPKKAEVTTTPEGQKEAVSAPAPAAETPSPVQENKPAATEETKESAAAAAEGLQPIYFDFDKSFVRSDALPVMKANVKWLKANPKARIKIEGNCDERGTKEYNLALGQRRAASAKKYLANMGISVRRISLISYGKEKPICTDHNETCWQKNRRDDFVLIE